MSNAFIAFLVAIGSGVWIYRKFMKYTGGNNQNSIIGATVSGVIIFIVMLTLLGFIPE